MTATTGTARTPTLHERRVKVLRRSGLADKHRMPLDKPSTTFYLIVSVVIALVLLGLVMVFSSSSVTNIRAGSSAWSYFRRQSLWAVLGGLGMWAMYRTPYENWGKQGRLLVGTGIVVAANMLVVLKGEVINNARAWLDVGPFRIQPSEALKLATILFCANLLSRRHRAVPIPSMVLVPMLSMAGLTIALCVAQRDFGTALIFVGIVSAMMFMGGIPVRQLAAVGSVFVVLGLGVLLTVDNASQRLFAFLDLEAVKEGPGYQVHQALLSIANGGLSGTGIGSGTSKWGYVPLAHSDFIFAVVVEELGVVGAIVVIGGFFMLGFLGIQVALSARDRQGALIAGGISAWFAIQAFVNIAGVLKVMPMTGLTLPFISYGGSSLLMSMVAAGLLLNVARYAKR